MARQQAPRVLDVHVPLERGLEQIAGGRGDREHDAERQRLPDREEVLLVERDEFEATKWLEKALEHKGLHKRTIAGAHFLLGMMFYQECVSYGGLDVKG